MARVITEGDVLALLEHMRPMSRRELARELGVPWMDASLAGAIAALDHKGKIDLDVTSHPERWHLTKGKQP